MPWAPLQQSGWPYNLDSPGVSIANSIVSASGLTGAMWVLSVSGVPRVQFRITALAYSATGAYSTPAQFRTIDADAMLEVPNTNGATGFAPSPFQLESFVDSGDGYLEYAGTSASETFAFLVEVMVGEPGSDRIQQRGRVSRVYASAHDRSRVHSTVLYPRETRSLLFDLNGLMPVGEKIVSVTYDQQYMCSVGMAAPQISADQRSTSVEITAAYRGNGVIRCQATTDKGSVYPQLAVVQVMCGPWFGDETPVYGPSSISVQA